MHKTMTKKTDDFINGKYKYVWIYGAGRIGKKLINIFNFFNISIMGVVITDYDGTLIPNIPVCELQEVTSSVEDTLFVITASKKYHNEIIDNIETHGFFDYIVWDKHCLCMLWKHTEHNFIDRRKYNNKCCFILAGYKEFLWDNIFERLVRFIPKDVDVCILSSGVYCDKLEKIAQRNGWSYLSTKLNSVTLIQNVAFSIYENYEWIYKIDEDIFTTNRAFEKLYSNYQKIKNLTHYEPGIVVPLIPVNGYGYYRILSESGKMSEYESRFGRVVIGGNPESEIEKNPETAIFMWRECLQIDQLNRLMEKEQKLDSCGVRYNIGFILLARSLWEDMQGFTVSGNLDMGTDEEELCSHCIKTSKAIMVSNNTVVGHFAFGRQTSYMKSFYLENPDRFKIAD